MNKYTKNEFPNELVIKGVLLACSKDVREWTDKTTGNPRKISFDVLMLQGDYGVICGRVINSSFDFTQFKIGETYYFPVEKFEKESGLKVAHFKI